MTADRFSIHSVRVRVRCLALVMVLAGCSGPPIELAVSIRTDLHPGLDFAVARVEFVPSDEGMSIEPQEVTARSTDPFSQGVPVANFVGLRSGSHRVRASLRNRAGEPVLERVVELSLQESYALAVVLNSDCLTRSCPGTSEPPSYTECLSGRCVEPRCGGPIGGGCGELACESQNDCQLECVAACIEGACVCVSDPPDAGPLPDTGPCPGECEPGEVGEEVSACGCSGEGTRVRMRVCDDDCRWGPFGEFGECSTASGCMPGESENRSTSCGNCGMKTQTRTCTESCTWGSWTDTSSCGNQGICTPGATGSRSTSCGNCGTKTQTRSCTNSCTWGSWTDTSSCGSQGSCSPGATSTRSTSCGNCGTKTQRRTCTNSCTWGSWTDTSSCGGQGSCSPGATRSGCDPCGHQVCSSSCSWGACEPKTAGGCLRIRPGTSGPEGNNYQCCGAGRWQFCLASCTWSTQCVSCKCSSC